MFTPPPLKLNSLSTRCRIPCRCRCRHMEVIDEMNRYIDTATDVNSFRRLRSDPPLAIITQNYNDTKLHSPTFGGFDPIEKIPIKRFLQESLLSRSALSRRRYEKQ